MGKQQLSSAKRIITHFHARRQAEIVSAGHLIDAWRAAPDVQEAHRDFARKDKLASQKKLQQAKCLVAHFKSSPMAQYDILFRAGFSPDENAISDALASLLDPASGHGLRDAPLRTFLSLIAKKAKPRSIRPKQFLGNDANVIVDREYPRGENTRPDIAIYSSGLLVFVENKLTFGAETSHKHGPQTARLVKLVQKYGEKWGIPQENRFAVFLSPRIVAPVNDDVIRISWEDLFHLWKDLFDHLQVEMRHHAENPAISGVQAFLTYLTIHRI